MIAVGGGTYHEQCVHPEWDEIWGSGLRAAVAIAQLGASVEFHTSVGQPHKALLESRSRLAKIKLPNVLSTTETVGFSYFHSMADSTLSGPSTTSLQLKIKQKTVLRFGMIEANLQVVGETVVYDPQSPLDPKLFTGNGSSAGRLAVVLNEAEARGMTQLELPAEALRAVAKLNQADVVVLKQGPLGCLVLENGKVTSVPAFKTKNVWGIGSGDVFTAVFALFWAERNQDAVTAADAASRATAYYCESKSLPHNEDFLSVSRVALRPLPVTARKQVYLAAPFFNLGQRWLVEELFELLSGMDVKVFSPIHHVGLGTAQQVYLPDVAGLEQSEIILACLDGADSGTLFELGYARAKNKRLIALATDQHDQDLVMPIGAGTEIAKDLVTAVHLAAWAANCE